MARQINKLSAAKLRSLAEPGRYGDGNNLYIQVSKGGARSWLFLYTIGGRAREMGLGSLQAVSLADARGKATECKGLLHRGLDPIEAREAQRQKQREAAAATMTFAQCAEKYIESHRPSWKNEKHAKQWPSTFETYVNPRCGNLPVETIGLDEILAVLKPHWAAKNETARRVRQRMEAVLDWAKVMGYRHGDNPARWTGNLEQLLPAPKTQVAHHPALPYADIAGFMKALQKQESVSARALEFLILTAARTSEVLGARWTEIDQEAKIWTIPAERMKAGKEHRVPLSSRAMGVVEEMSKARDPVFIFPSQRAGHQLSNMALLALLKRMKRADITPNGFRSTFRDWAAESTDFPSEVAEMALAHNVGTQVEKAYRRGQLLDKRRALMKAWSLACYPRAHLTKPVVDTDGGEPKVARVRLTKTAA